MKFIALDIGERRIGVAFGDEDLNIATPVSVIKRTTIEQDARIVADLVRRYDVSQLVVGLPRNMDGSEGMQANSVRLYSRKLTQIIDIPIEFWDERLTTAEALERRNSTNARGKRSRRILDAIAAAVILQDYMNNQRRET